MLTQEHHRQVCQDVLNQYEAEGDGFLECAITSDEMWCHHYGLESKWQSMERQHEFTIKDKVQDKALNGKSDMHCLLGYEKGNPSGFPRIPGNHQL